MGLENEEFDCDSPPSALSPAHARGYWFDHRRHECELAAAAWEVLNGARGLPWPNAPQLHNPLDWSNAYRDHGLPTEVTADGTGVELVCDDTVTALLVPAGPAGATYDRNPLAVPTLATAPPYVPLHRWAMLSRTAPLSGDAVRALAELHITVLAPGDRLRLPTGPDAGLDPPHYWHEWPRRSTSGEPHLVQLVQVANMLLTTGTPGCSLAPVDGRLEVLRKR
ncbi:hypothetical protein [Nocardia fluminea]|uniref:Uncharacterized protein n=1 Tax=Nocardia fluminea TaxID=134984 RepID=A0A2N3WXE0_9NOCA|nr:hypothetical protein [Nocardia fluminea]PKV98562.1 hypothetical protein ATK86_0583 [Nocardia fluminea]